MTSRFTLSYTTQGRGFNYHLAGASNAGAEKADPDHYKRVQKMHWADPVFTQRMQQSLNKVCKRAEFYKQFVETTKERDKALDALAASVVRLEEKLEENEGPEASQRNSDMTMVLIDICVVHQDPHHRLFIRYVVAEMPDIENLQSQAHGPQASFGETSTSHDHIDASSVLLEPNMICITKIDVLDPSEKFPKGRYSAGCVLNHSGWISQGEGRKTSTTIAVLQNEQ
ncbi:hypothetical protein BDZ45DRAFT_692383 [Acephala macrosclerotiorum]|nr:hypothetical protein BDZ45DRAFT_692383 [Acephala macrosclerotiorum]